MLYEGFGLVFERKGSRIWRVVGSPVLSVCGGGVYWLLIQGIDCGSNARSCPFPISVGATCVGFGHGGIVILRVGWASPCVLLQSSRTRLALPAICIATLRTGTAPKQGRFEAGGRSTASGDPSVLSAHDARDRRKRDGRARPRQKSMDGLTDSEFRSVSIFEPANINLSTLSVTAGKGAEGRRMKPSTKPSADATKRNGLSPTLMDSKLLGGKTICANRRQLDPWLTEQPPIVG